MFKIFFKFSQKFLGLVLGKSFRPRKSSQLITYSYICIVNRVVTYVDSRVSLGQSKLNSPLLLKVPSKKTVELFVDVGAKGSQCCCCSSVLCIFLFFIFLNVFVYTIRKKELFLFSTKTMFTKGIFYIIFLLLLSFLVVGSLVVIINCLFLLFFLYFLYIFLIYCSFLPL